MASGIFEDMVNRRKGSERCQDERNGTELREGDEAEGLYVQVFCLCVCVCVCGVLKVGGVNWKGEQCMVRVCVGEE